MKSIQSNLAIIQLLPDTYRLAVNAVIVAHIFFGHLSCVSNKKGLLVHLLEILSWVGLNISPGRCLTEWYREWPYLVSHRANPEALTPGSRQTASKPLGIMN